MDLVFVQDYTISNDLHPNPSDVGAVGFEPT